MLSASHSVKNAEFVAVYSRKYETGAAFAEKHGIEKVYTDLDSMLDDPDIDAVYIASPNYMHAPQAIASMERGKHVLCEKSIATDYPEFQRMRRTAEKCGRVLCEAMRPQYDPSYEILRSALARLGGITDARFEFCKYSSRYDNFKRGIIENAFDPKIKNSALADIGVYPLWMAVALLGAPRSFSCQYEKLHNGFHADGRISLDYGDFCASVIYSKIRSTDNPSYVKGEHGTLYINEISKPSRITFVDNSGNETLLYTTPCENNMVYELSAFCSFLQTNIDFIPYLDITEEVQRIMHISLFGNE
jgi:predicted dehydrogenase